jgi:hypothetical protein
MKKTSLFAVVLFLLSPAAPELLMNNLGYRPMGEGKMDEAIAAFKSNV